MNHDLISTSATALHISFQELLDIIDTTSSMNVDAAHKEAEQLVDSLVAAVLMKEHGIREDEKAFFEMLVSYDKAKSCNNRLLINLAEQWETLRHSVPQFFYNAAEFDRINQTRHTTEIRCRLQSIGNCAAISDSGLGPGESKIVRDYMKILETVG